MQRDREIIGILKIGSSLISLVALDSLSEIFLMMLTDIRRDNYESEKDKNRDKEVMGHS